MNTIDKNKIKEMFQAKCTMMQLSQEKGAVAAGTKGTTVSQVFNGTYPANDDAVYKLLAIWVDYKNLNWNIAETVNYKFISNLLTDAKVNGKVYAIIGDAGCGKTFTMKRFSEKVPNAFMLCCAEYWNRKQFLRELLSKMGREYGGLTVNEMMELAITSLLAMNSPIIMMDEADKLSDQVLYFFITLYNRLEDQCGLIMSATPHLTRRLERGRNTNKKGYAEIWSRINSKPVVCEKTREKDVKAVCIANGIEDMATIKIIFQECEGDLRRVKTGIHRSKLMDAA